MAEQITYNGQTIEEMVTDLNTYVQQHNPIKIDLQPVKSAILKGEERYTSITKHNLLRVYTPDAVRHGFYAEYENGWMLLDSIWIEHIHHQVMEWQRSHPQWTKDVYVRLPEPEEREPYNVRRHTAVAANPHDYGYVTWKEAAEQLHMTEEELQQKNMHHELENHQVLIYAPDKPHVMAMTEVERLLSLSEGH